MKAFGTGPSLVLGQSPVEAEDVSLHLLHHGGHLLLLLLQEHTAMQPRNNHLRLR